MIATSSFPKRRGLPGLSALLLLPLALGLAITPALGIGDSPGLSIRLVEGTVFEVIGLDADALQQFSSTEPDSEDWGALFAVRVEKAENSMLGTYRIAEGSLRFEPRFPLQPGLGYQAIVQPGKLPGADPTTPPISADFEIPKPPERPSTRVVAIYPSGDILPENLLRFYLHFSEPMSQGEAYDHVELIGPDGVPVERPFLELGQELWDPSGTRLTLLIDPGRIKSGLEPREIFGPVLEEGNAYTLVIASDWPDALDNPLAAPFRKAFRAGPPEEEPIDPQSWNLQVPDAGTIDPLVLNFPRPLDHAMLERVLTVLGPEGNRIPGTIELAEQESRWRFTPKTLWESGTYRLQIDPALEDRAGNSVGRSFELDVLEQADPALDPRPANVTLPFQVQPPQD